MDYYRRVTNDSKQLLRFFELNMERGLVCPVKAQEYDNLHKFTPKYGRQNAGAKELASGYTRSMTLGKGGGAWRQTFWWCM